MGLKEGEEGSEGALASDADGRSPREPGITLVSSDRLKWYDQRLSEGRFAAAHMSPNRFSVSTTPLSFRGSETMNIAAESTSW